MPHDARAPLASRYPVHVTVRVRGVLWQAFAASRERLGARLVHFSVQRDHVHMLVEARDRTALSRAIQGLSIRIARSRGRSR